MNKDRNSHENINIIIEIGQHKAGMSIPKQTKVSSLLTIVKGYESLHAQYAPLDTYFIGLASKNNNSVIDYWLTQKQLNFCRFYKTLQLKALYSIQKSVQKLAINNFQFLKCLGKGACGSVYLVRNRITGYLFAMKRLLKQSITDYKSWQTIMRQKQILASFPLNPHTVTFHGSFQSQNHFNLLLDYYPGGQLFLHLTTNQCKLSQKQAKIYFCQILLAMEFLHKQKILYRDLKPQNILVDILGHLKITDFGLSKCGFQEEDIAYSQCGSPQYMAPEVLENKDYNFSADFYSIGAILYQLLTGLPPYYGCDQDQSQKLYQMKNMDLDFNQFKSQNLRKLLQHLLNPQPQHRLCNFQQIKNNPWLADIKWKQIQQKKDVLKFAPDIYKSYIGQQFLDLHEQVQQMNISENQGRKTYFEAIFNFVKQQSKEILLGECSQQVEENKIKIEHLKDKTSINQNTKRKTTDFVKQKQKLTKHKANYSIQLFDKEQSTNSSHSSSTQNSNSSNLPYNPRTTRNQDTNKQNLMLFKKSYKILSSNYQSSTNNANKLTKQPSQTNLIRPPSQQKIIIKQPKTPIRLMTSHNTHNTSQCEMKQIKKSAIKQTIRKSDNFSSIVKRQDRILQKNPQTKCKSKSKSKQKSQMKSIKLKQKPSSTIKLKKDLVPTCSYKIKLM